LTIKLFSFQTLAQTLISSIEEVDNIVVFRHSNSDPDALGSQLGFVNGLKAKFKNKQVYAAGDENKGLDFIGKMDEIPENVFNNFVAIVLDTANEDRVSDQRFKLAKTVFKIDHHPDREPFGDFSFVDTNFSSCSEIIYSLGVVMNISLTPKIAQLLYTGMVGDTGRFYYSNTNGLTFEIASKLIDQPFDPRNIYSNLYTKSLEETRANGYLLANFSLTSKNIAYFHFTEELLKTFNINRTQASNLVNSMADITGIPIWVLFVDSDDEIRVRIRSSKTEIVEVARKFSGGGHPLASGATLTEIAQINTLLNELDNLL
jgi:phosphoesterase RecJ-like protein